MEISYIQKDGNLSIMNIDVPAKEMFGYEYANKQKSKYLEGWKSWDEQPVRKVPAKTLDKHRIQEYFMDNEEVLAPLFEQNTPNLFACDIEVEVTDDGFPDPESARNKITAIAVSYFPHVVVWGCKPLNKEEQQFVENEMNSHLKDVSAPYKLMYKYFENEAEMLENFLKTCVRKVPLLTGWNFWGYDWMYICNRAKKLNVDISICSPTGEMRNFRFDDKRGKKTISIPQHKLIVDYMKIYEKWDRTVKIKENSTLNFVAESALGIKKINYPGTLKELFIKDYLLYIAYNAVDTIIVELLDKKLKTMGTFLGLGNLTRVEALTAFSPINMCESTLTRYAYPKQIVFPKRENNSVSQQYEGALVHDPKPGMYKLVASLDYASLYPSLQRQFNISIENFLFKDKDYIPKEDEKVIKCASGAVFKNDKQYLLPEMLTDFYNKRKDAKKIAKKAEHDYHELERIYKERVTAASV
ncbi:MAG: DNA polymerase domain-containing protein [Clostridia bacterium]